MKKILYLLIGMDSLLVIYGTLSILSESILYSIIVAALGIINLVPLIAIVHCLNATEDNAAGIAYLQTKIKSIEDASADADTYVAYSAALKHSDSPKKPWKCLKCDTVNKAEDSICAGCKAEYSYTNPTFDSIPKKKSRFVKF